MMALPTETIRRITVALDASASSLAALEAALDLAAQWEAEVEGIFVEDINLLRWASLPFAVEVGHVSGEFRRSNRPDVERQLQALADRAHAHLRRAADRRRVRARFRKVQGNVVAALRAALAEADLVTLGRGERPRTAHAGLGSTARALAGVQRGLVCVISQRIRLPSPIALLFHDSPAGQRALAVAIGVARRSRQPLAIIAAGEPGAVPPNLIDQVSREAVELTTVLVRRHTPARVASAARDIGAGILVMSASQFSPDDIEQVAAAFSGALLLVGEPGP